MDCSSRNGPGVRAPVAVLVCAAAVLAACSRDLSLPAARTGPQIATVNPTSGYAESLVTLTGSGFGTDTTAVSVRFGRSGAVAPEDGLTDTTLAVRVPDDASSGPITVTSRSGAGTTQQSFTFSGVGRLRVGRVAATADLRSRLQSVVAIPGDDGAQLDVIEATYHWGGTLSDPAPIPVNDNDVAAQAVSGDGRVTAWVDLLPQVDCSSPDDHGHLLLFGIQSLCLPGGVRLESTREDSVAVALDQTGTQALVAIEQKLWLVQVNTSPVQITTLSTQLFGRLRAASLGSDLWLVSDKFGFHLFDGAARALHDAADAPSSWDSTGPAQLALRLTPPQTTPVTPPEVAVTAVLGQVELFSLRRALDDRVAPAKADLVRTLDTTTGHADVSGVAFSADGTTLAASVSGAGRVITFDSSFAPIAGAQVEEPAEVSALGSLFYVAARGGVAQLSSRTGELVSVIALPVLPGLPQLRQVAQATGKKVPAQLDLPVSTFNAIARLDPLTLRASPTPWQGAFDCVAASSSTTCVSPDTPQLTALVPLPVADSTSAQDAALLFDHPVDGRSVVAPSLHDQTRGEVVDARHPLRLSRPSTASIERLQASPDGTLLFYAQGDTDGVEVQVLPAAGAWDGQLRSFSLGATPQPVLFDGAGHFALVDGTQLRLFDLAVATATSPTPTLTLPFESITGTGGGLIAAGAGGGSLFLIFSTIEGTLLYTLPQGATALLGPSALNHAPAFLGRDLTVEITVAVGGHRLYWLEGDPATRSLVRVAVDPATGEVGDEETPVAITGDRLQLHPDGVHLFVVDSNGDSLQLLE